MRKQLILLALFLAPVLTRARGIAPVFDAVVDKNGTGDYRTIREAIDKAPAERTAPWLIFIKNGRYEEILRIPQNKPFLRFIGQDKDSVVITYKINCSNPENPKDPGPEYSNRKMGLPNCAVFVVEAPDFFAENISFENGWGVEQQSGPQALAIKTNNDRFAFYNCKFRSFQDTWMTSTKGMNDRIYVNDCWIEGAVDYFYGGGNAWVEHCTLYNVRSGSVIVAPNHRDSTKWGYVFDHCIVDGNKAAADGRLRLGRPWHNRPVAVYLNTTMKIIPHPEGWMDMGPAAKMFAEYNSRDASGKLLDLSGRRTWYKQSQNEGGQRVEGLTAVLTEKDVAKYTYENIIKADDGWDPKLYFYVLPAPKDVKNSAGILRWTENSEARGYIIYLNEQVIGYSTDAMFRLPAGLPAKGRYSVQCVNKYGAIGDKSDAR